MDSKRVEEISELVTKFMEDRISFEEFDQLVSEEEYNEWSMIITSQVNEKVTNYLRNK